MEVAIVKRFSWFPSLLTILQNTYNELGHGLLELNYQRAIEIQLMSEGIKFIQEYPIHYKFRDTTLSIGRLDLLIQQEGIVEIKAQASDITESSLRQLHNYLLHTRLPIGIAVNFPKAPLNYPNSLNHNLAIHVVVHPSVLSQDALHSDAPFAHLEIRCPVLPGRKHYLEPTKLITLSAFGSLVSSTSPKKNVDKNSIGGKE